MMMAMMEETPSQQIAPDPAWRVGRLGRLQEFGDVGVVVFVFVRLLLCCSLLHLVEAGVVEGHGREFGHGGGYVYRKSVW